MTEDTHARDGAHDRRGTALLSASRYALLFAVLLLCGTALALVVADAETANGVAALAYWALAAGVALRVLAVTTVPARIAAVGRRTRGGADRVLSRWPAARRHVVRVGARARARAARTATAVRTHSALDADLEEGIRLSMPLTFVVGAMLVAWWWFDPARTVSVWFIAGWGLAILGQLWLSVVIPELRRA